MCVCGDGGGVLTGSSERELKKVVKIKQVCMRSVCMWGGGRVLIGSSERELKEVVKIKQVCMRTACMWWTG